MSHIVTDARVNQFLPSEKLEIPAGELHSNYNGKELEDTIWDIVSAKLHDYDLSSWTNASGTVVANQVPKLVLDIIAMWVAGSIYLKQFAEESTETGNNYGTMLKNDAMALLQGLVDETLMLTDLVLSDTGGELLLPTVEETEEVFTMEGRF